ncbi:hypothetical protein ES704_01961 [subsurface metagenome]|jgi:hypothetical protein
MDRNYNFMPAVKCPHCGKLAHPEISGWGGELSTRVKYCRYCQQEYRLVVFSFTDKEIDSTTCRINSEIDRIKYLKQRIKEKLNNIANKSAEWAEEFIRVEASTGGKQN